MLHKALAKYPESSKKFVKLPEASKTAICCMKFPENEMFSEFSEKSEIYLKLFETFKNFLKLL